MLAANGADLDRLHLGVEAREIGDRLRGTPFSDRFELIVAMAVRPEDLLELLNRHRPHIVHFSGHGGHAGIYLEEDSGKSVLVDGATLEEVFRVLRDSVQLVVLNACLSEQQAIAITRHIDFAIGMSEEVDDNAAIRFAEQFYRALAYGRDVRNAFEQGRLAIRLGRAADHEVPRLWERKDRLSGPVVFTSHSDERNGLSPEVERFANWAYTGLGLFTAIVALFTLARRSRAFYPMRLPVIAELHYGETILVGCGTALLGVMFLLTGNYLYATKSATDVPRWEKLLPALGHQLRDILAPIRCLIFVVLVLFPFAVSVGISAEILIERGAINTRTGEVLRGWSIFSFPTGFMLGEDWRWNSRVDGDRPSFYPGLQPMIYIAGIAYSSLLLGGILWQLFARGRQKLSDAVGDNRDLTWRYFSAMTHAARGEITPNKIASETSDSPRDLRFGKQPTE